VSSKWYGGPMAGPIRCRSVEGMRLVYDPELDVALLVVDEGGAAGARHAAVGGVPAGSYVDAEYDEGGRLVAFEVIGARKVLPPEVLARAERE
jgi:uncharacterized protein YuzE